MCIDHKMICSCGRNTASFNFRDNLMPVEVVAGLYCPNCSEGLKMDDATMLNDNGWVIRYDMEVAGFISRSLPVSEITPAFIFDEGYCTWRGVYPTDHIDSVREREELVKLAKINPKKYLDEFRKWGLERMERLAREGWRKAGENVSAAA